MKNEGTFGGITISVTEKGTKRNFEEAAKEAGWM